MKVLLAKSLIIAVWLLMLFTAVTCIKPPAGHGDFDLRMNELECLSIGVNPFAIWSEEVVLPPYVSNLPKNGVPEGCTKQVNAYAPWEYTYMMPLSFLPRHLGWFVYCLLMGVSIVFLVKYSTPTDGWATDPTDRRIIAMFPLAVVSYLLWSNASVGNFIAFILAASVIMGWALSRGNHIVAGLMWAIAMIKPQSAILFAVPLLMRGKLKACIVAGATCLIASFLPAAMCDESVFDLLLQGPAANVDFFEGCGTWPKFFCGYLGNGVDIALGLAIGTVLCIWMTRTLRREKDWLVYLMPAAICASCWTYTQAYSHAMGWFVAYAIVSELLRHPRSRFLWTLLILSVPVLSRVFLAWHGFCAFFGCEFPMSDYAFRSVESLNSMASLVIAAAFCLWRRRCSQNDVSEFGCMEQCPKGGAR